MKPMTRAAARSGLLVLLLAVASGAAAAPERLAVRVWPAFSQAPATLRIEVTLEPDERNRALLIMVDSGDYFRSSAIPLDGAHAARFYTVHYASVPAGAYLVAAEVQGARGEARAAERVAVQVMP